LVGSIISDTVSDTYIYIIDIDQHNCQCRNKLND